MPQFRVVARWAGAASGCHPAPLFTISFLDRANDGYAVVHVDLTKVRGPEHGGIKLRDVEKRMSWSTAVVNALISEGLLPARTAINPKNRCPQTVVDEEDLEAFDAEYVALHRLAQERGTHFKRLKRELEEASVAPAPRFQGVPATFYRRDEIALVIGDKTPCFF